MKRMATLIASIDGRVMGVVITERPDTGFLTCYDEFAAAKKYAEEVLNFTNIKNNVDGSLYGDAVSSLGHVMYTAKLIYHSINDDSLLTISHEEPYTMPDGISNEKETS